MITRTSIIAITLALASTANAWVVPNKAAFEKIAAAGAVSAALFTAPLVSHAAQFDGTYTGTSTTSYLYSQEYSRGVPGCLLGTLPWKDTL